MPRGAHMKAKWQDPEYRAKQASHLPQASKVAAEKRAKPKIQKTCEICGATFEVNEYRNAKQNPRFCSRSCHQAHQVTLRGELSTKWQGGTTRHGHGYVLQWTESGHVLQHRLVMEQHIGRPLRTDEHVHHLNGVKTDNRIENLQLLSASEHSRLTSMKRWHGK